MASDREALALRAVACKHWRWVPGMRLRGVVLPTARATITAVGGAQLLLADGQIAGIVSSNRTDRVVVAGLEIDWLPDLDDPATIGCLLGLVREAWGEPDAHTVRHTHPTSGGKWWSVGSERRSPIAPHLVALAESEAEALICALEASHGE